MSKVNSIKKQKHIDDFLAAMQKTAGNISSACNATNLSRSWYYKEIENNPEFAEAIKDITEATGDFVETALMKQIQEGNTACIIFFCKTKLKHRGFVERQEVDHSGNIGILNGGEIDPKDFALIKQIAEKE